MTQRGVSLETSSGLRSARKGFRWIGGRKSPFAGCWNAPLRAELDRGRGPLIGKQIPVVAMMVMLLVLVLLSSRTLQP